MLNGTVPYDADAPYAVIMKHINDPLPMPRQFNAALPEAVERVVLKALAKNKEDRFQTATEFKTALENAKQAALSQMQTHTGKATAPAPANPVDKTVAGSAQPNRRSRMPLAIGAVAVVVVAGIVVLVLSGRSNAGSTSIPLAPAFTSTQPTIQTAGAVATTSQPSTNAPSTPGAVPQASNKYAALTDQVNKLLIQGSQDQALPLVEAALKDDPQSYDLLVLRGRAYAESGDDVRDKAEPDAQAAIKIDPNRPDAFVVLGQYYMIVEDSLTNDERIAQYKKAITNYTQAINIGTQDYRAYWGRALTNTWLNGYIGSDKGVPDSAIIADYDKAASFSPQDVRFYEDRGHFYLDRFNFVEVQKNYEQVLKLQPDAYYDHPYLAAAYMAQDMKPKAYDLYANAIEKDNYHDHKYLADAAYVAWVNGKPDKANEWAKLGLALDPNTLAETGKLDDAIAAYDEALKQEQYWPTLYIEQAKILMKQGKNDQAAQDLRTALDNAISQKDKSAQTEIMSLLSQIASATETSTPTS